MVTGDHVIAVNHQTGCTTFPFISLSSASVPCCLFRSFFQFPLEINLSPEADCSVSCTFLKTAIQEVMSDDVLTFAHVYSMYFLRKILQETTHILSPPEICCVCVSVIVHVCVGSGLFAALMTSLNIPVKRPQLL